MADFGRFLADIFSLFFAFCLRVGWGMRLAISALAASVLLLHSQCESGGVFCRRSDVQSYAPIPATSKMDVFFSAAKHVICSANQEVNLDERSADLNAPIPATRQKRVPRHSAHIAQQGDQHASACPICSANQEGQLVGVQTRQPCP